MAKEKIALSDLVSHVTAELLTAHAQAKPGQQKVMQFAECQIDFAVEAEKEVGGGIKVWILDLKGGGKRTESNTVTVKFSSIPSAAMQYMQDVGEGGPELKKQ